MPKESPENKSEHDRDRNGPRHTSLEVFDLFVALRNVGCEPVGSFYERLAPAPGGSFSITGIILPLAPEEIDERGDSKT